MYTVLVGQTFHSVYPCKSLMSFTLSSPVRATSLSMPGVFFPAFSWVTLLMLKSRLAWLRSISFVRLLTLFHCFLWVAWKILCLKFLTKAFCLSQSMLFQSVSSSPLAPIWLPNLSFTLVRFSYFVSFMDTCWKSAVFRLGQILNPYPKHCQGHSLFPASFTLWIVPLSLRLAYSGFFDQFQRIHRAYCSSVCLRFNRFGFHLFSGDSFIPSLIESQSLWAKSLYLLVRVCQPLFTLST